MNAKTVGNDGELWAVRYLEKQGYRIIDTNVRPFSGMRRGEIDIVAWDGDVLVVIEVKTRSSRYFDAVEAITPTKRKQLTRLAVAYIHNHGIHNTECRFDVVCVYNSTTGPYPEIDLRRGAFDPVY